MLAKSGKPGARPETGNAVGMRNPTETEAKDQTPTKQWQRALRGTGGHRERDRLSLTRQCLGKKGFGLPDL